MNFLPFQKLHFPLLTLLVLASMFFSSCGDNDLTNYKERIIGEWELKNVADLQPAYKNRPFLLKNATMIFYKNGTLETRMLSNQDKKTWITETATWTVSQTKNINQLPAIETLTIKADNSPFNDDIDIEFTNERTFILTLNGLIYQFVKL